MPNYCYNTLTVTLSRNERKRFLKAIVMPRLTWEEYKAEQGNPYDSMEVTEHWTAEIIAQRRKEHEEYQYERWQKSTEYLCFCQALLPCPSELWQSNSPANISREEALRRIIAYGAVDWYRWCINNWGTKWGDFKTEVTKDRCKKTVIKFESAWSPPTDALLTISKMFPRLRFHLRAKEEDCHAWAYGIQDGRFLYERRFRYR